jgi:hypothetical protein
MTGRELVRRPVAMGLLTVLPLAFYGASAHHSNHAVVTGGIAMAFSIAGGSIFAALTARPVDERLVLAGYRPRELVLGRLVLLELFGLLIATLFGLVMVLGTGPSHPWALVTGMVLVAITSVPFGLAVGALAPGELEAVLILIGVVGIQLTLESTQTIAKLLPFWGAQRLLQHSIDGTVATGAAILVGVVYALLLLAASAQIVRLRAPRSAHVGHERSVTPP